MAYPGLILRWRGSPLLSRIVKRTGVARSDKKKCFNSEGEGGGGGRRPSKFKKRISRHPCDPHLSISRCTFALFFAAGFFSRVVRKQHTSDLVKFTFLVFRSEPIFIIFCQLRRRRRSHCQWHTTVRRERAHVRNPKTGFGVRFKLSANRYHFEFVRAS